VFIILIGIEFCRRNELYPYDHVVFCCPQTGSYCQPHPRITHGTIDGPPRLPIIAVATSPAARRHELTSLTRQSQPSVVLSTCWSGVISSPINPISNITQIRKVTLMDRVVHWKGVPRWSNR
jgi:hypothetical protein